MLKNYLKVAFKVLLRRKIYAGANLFGIAFTLLVLVVCVSLADQFLSSGYPQTRLDRTLIITRAELRGSKFWRMSTVGYGLLDRYARDLTGVERFSIVSEPFAVTSFVEGNKVESKLRRSDAAFWEIMEFDFLEGGPFTAADEEHGNFVAVINERTRDRIFNGKPAMGRMLRAGGQAFTVVGVVRNVPLSRLLAFSEIWVPHHTASSPRYRDDFLGRFMGILLAKDRSRFPEIKADFQRRLAEAELPDPELFDTVNSAAHTPFELAASTWLGGGDTDKTPTIRMSLLIGVMTLLFMTLPALNLINLNLSRILERSSEIGVRKAFGASSGSLVGQFLVENVLLTLVGGVVALVTAELVMAMINESEWIPYASVHVNYRIFLYGLFLAGFFGVFSGAYPAWRMSRLHPVQALRGRV